jgi:hypothetical protein
VKRLFVTLTADEHVNKGPGRPVFNADLRAENLAALECVDYVAINNKQTAVNVIRLLSALIFMSKEVITKTLTMMSLAISNERSKSPKNLVEMLSLQMKLFSAQANCSMTTLVCFLDKHRYFLSDFGKSQQL